MNNEHLAELSVHSVRKNETSYLAKARFECISHAPIAMKNL